MYGFLHRLPSGLIVLFFTFMSLPALSHLVRRLSDADCSIPPPFHLLRHPVASRPSCRRTFETQRRVTESRFGRGGRRLFHVCVADLPYLARLIRFIQLTSRPLWIPFRPLPCRYWQPAASPGVCRLARRSSGGNSFQSHTDSAPSHQAVVRRYLYHLLLGFPHLWRLVRRSPCSIPRQSKCFIQTLCIVHASLPLPCPLIPS